MKYLPLKIIILCIILPPVLHWGVVQSLEHYLKAKYKVEIENIYTGDTRALYTGSIKVKDAVNNNIDHFLQTSKLIAWGVRPNVLVTTKKGAIIYPSFEEEDSLIPPSLKQIKIENYQILSTGMNVQVDISLEQNSILVISIFSSFLLLSLFILFFFYRKGLIKERREKIHQRKEINRLVELEKENKERMAILNKDKAFLSNEFIRIKSLLEDSIVKTKRNEDDMIDEIVALEEKIENIHSLYDEQQEENNELKEIISKYEKGELKTPKQIEKASKHLTKRFKTLYKNIAFHEYAITGFADLTEEMQIKAEEVISRMNTDLSLVKIKRKVAILKNPEAVFEITFSNDGRLYFSRGKDKKSKILSVGTKNTQDRDISFINSLQ